MNNRLPSHNPWVGTYHHGRSISYDADHPFYLYSYRQNPSIPMIAHAPHTLENTTKKNNHSLRSLFSTNLFLSALIPHSNFTSKDDWIVVERPESQNSIQSKTQKPVQE